MTSPVLLLPGYRTANAQTVFGIDASGDTGFFSASALNIATGFTEDMVFYAKNTSGGTINIGDACMFTGVVGASGKLTFGLAVSDGSVSYEYMMGVALENIDNNGFGFVTHFGLVRGWNTTGSTKTIPETWNDGDLLYFDPSYPGELTKTPPTSPAIHHPIAVVINAGSGGSGSVFVRMRSGENLSELHDVYVNGSLTDGDLLQYDGVDGRWETTSGASGSFTAASGEVVTVSNGIITNIV